MLRIWIFFNKQTIYLEEATVQRKNQIAEQAGANLGRIHSWKNDIHNRVRTPGKCSPRIYLPFSKQSIGAIARGSTSLVWQLLSFGSANSNYIMVILWTIVFLGELAKEK